jgi:SPP1 gp7 family putative phage head morphogenesis protein
MPDDIPVKLLFGKPPEAVVEYFEKKIPRGPEWHWNWKDTMRHSHDKAFVVAKATSISLVESIHKELTKSLKNGKSYQDFANNIIPILNDKGWWGKGVPIQSEEKIPKRAVIDIGHERLKNIFYTNMKTAYAAGEYAEMKAEAEDYPYWRYMAQADGDNRRQEHQLLSGKIFRHDDPVWSYIYPPNGWGCQCWVDALSEFDIKHDNLKVSKTSPKNIEAIKSLVQEGWDYAPGESLIQYQNMLYKKIDENLTGEAKAAMQSQLNASINDGFKNLVNQTLETGITRTDEAVTVGILPNRVTNALNNLRGDRNAAISPVLTATTERIWHSQDTGKQADDKAMPPQKFANLPSLLYGWMQDENKLRTEQKISKKSKGSLLVFSNTFVDKKVGENEILKRYKVVFEYDKDLNRYVFKTATKVDAGSMKINYDSIF